MYINRTKVIGTHRGRETKKSKEAVTDLYTERNKWKEIFKRRYE